MRYRIWRKPHEQITAVCALIPSDWRNLAARSVLVARWAGGRATACKGKTTVSVHDITPEPVLLNSDDLSAFIDGFFGYGNLAAPLWFVGMEEGGGTSADEIRRRLAAWQRCERPALADLALFHRSFGAGHLFEKGARTQRTWKELIRIALMIEGRVADNASIGAHQVDGFGRIDGPVALLELLPLPKPSIKSWPYAHWTCARALPYLQKRKWYQDRVLRARIDAIRRLSDRYRPRAIIFYGKTYQPHWEAIARRQFEPCAYPMTALSEHTTYMLLPHPTARGGSQTPHYTRAADMLRHLLG